jgi:hypothetical protein
LYVGKITHAFGFMTCFPGRVMGGPGREEPTAGGPDPHPFYKAGRPHPR